MKIDFLDKKVIMRTLTVFLNFSSRKFKIVVVIKVL